MSGDGARDRPSRTPGFQAYYATAVATSLDDHAQGFVEHGDRRSGYFHAPGALIGDPWLKPAGAGGAAAARQRLTLPDGRFDASSDRSAIGTGRWDPLAQRNVPYTLAGEAVRDHLSRRYRSSHVFDGRSCQDARLGCR